jgi:hypothetical protein
MHAHTYVHKSDHPLIIRTTRCTSNIISVGRFEGREIFFPRLSTVISPFLAETRPFVSAYNNAASTHYNNGRRARAYT